MPTLPPLRDAVHQIVRNSVTSLANNVGDPVLNKSRAEFQSDYQTPAAMQLANRRRPALGDRRTRADGQIWK